MKRYTHATLEYPVTEENLEIIFGGTLPSLKTLKSKGYELVVEDVSDDIASLDEMKMFKKTHLKGLFIAKINRPRIDTGLGFEVDGSKDDLVNLEIAKSLELDFVKDADGKLHQIKISDWDVILKAIKQKGVLLFQEKWELETKIDACTTILELSELDTSGAFGTAVAEKV